MHPTSSGTGPSDLGGFNAIQTDARPADPTGAMGLHSFVTAVNSQVAVYDLKGRPLLGPFGLRQLHSIRKRAVVGDPKVVFDPYAEEFILVFLEWDFIHRISRIVLTSIPDSSADQRGSWCVRSIAGDQRRGDGAQLADYPGLGFTRDSVTITSNQYSWFGESAVYAQILQFAKSTLYNCSRRLGWYYWTKAATKIANGRQATTIQPAISYGNGSPDQYLFSIEGQSGRLSLWQIQGVGRNARLGRTSVKVPSERPPWPGTQGGAMASDTDTWWDTLDGRLTSAFFDADNGRAYAARAVNKNLSRGDRYPEAVIRWYEVAPGARLNASRLTRTGFVGEAKTDAAFPAIATDARGTVFIAYSRASAPKREHLSAYAASIPQGSTKASTTRLVEGNAVYNAKRGIERWGDFNAISRDPSDGRIMCMVNQFPYGSRHSTDHEIQTVDLISR